MTEVDRSDPELKFLVVDRNAFSDPATQAEWAQKRLVWVPDETYGFIAASMKRTQGEEVEVENAEEQGRGGGYPGPGQQAVQAGEQQEGGEGRTPTVHVKRK